MDTTKERARRSSKTMARRKRLTPQQWAAEVREQCPPEPPKDLTSDLITVYEVVTAAGKVISRHLELRLAHAGCFSWNSCQFADEADQVASVRTREGVLCSIGKGAEAFPPLAVGFYRPDGSLANTFTQDDPRGAFCKFFNERSRDLVAGPLKEGGAA